MHLKVRGLIRVAYPTQVSGVGGKIVSKKGKRALMSKKKVKCFGN